MANPTINLTFKIEESGDLKTLALDADKLSAAMRHCVKVAEQTKRSFKNWGVYAVEFNALNNAINGLTQGLSSITAESGQFSAAMKAANTMAGKGAADFAKLKGEVAELSKTLPTMTLATSKKPTADVEFTFTV